MAKTQHSFDWIIWIATNRGYARYFLLIFKNLVSLIEVLQAAEGRHSSALGTPHPELEEVDVVTRLCQQRKTRLLRTVPVPSHVAVRKVIKSNLRR